MSNLIKVTSKIEFDSAFMKKLDQASARALEQTAEALHAEVVQAEVMPRKDGVMQGERTHIKAGETITTTYEDGTEVTNSITHEKNGMVYIITAAPQVRRLYFHPEYHFHHEAWEEYVVEKNGKKRSFETQDEAKAYAGNDGKIHHLTHQGNPNAKGKWFEDWLPGGKNADFAADAFRRLYRREAGL